jgi:hypothetical protein
LKTALVPFGLLLLLACVAGAILTARSIAIDGFASSPSVSAFQTAVRLAAVLGAGALWRFARGPLTKAALACWVIAAGSSALHYGLGMNSTSLQVVRQLFHLFAYSLSAIVLASFLTTQPSQLPEFQK